MYARVVRFTNVEPKSIDNVRAEVEQSGGPPPGVNARSMQMLYDADQRTSLFIAYFDTAEDMAEADRIMGAMDVADTPGTRASVDMSEVVIDRQA
jgi:hypothetical protein